MADGLFGTASFEAAGKLVALGYRHVMWFRGGEEAWAQAGYPAKSPRM
jgi:rhodanese-related sulfurtransferase